MDFALTQHATEVLIEREIDLHWVEFTLNFPELIEQDREDDELEHRLAVIKEYGNRVLRVVFNKQVKPIRIVTVYFDRKMKGLI